MTDTTNQQAGTVETKADFQGSPSEFTKHWLEAIDLAGTDEEKWRESAAETLKRYRQGKPKGFNILYANTQTVVPALYNSEPVPDVRRRFGDEDPAGKEMARLIERGLSVQCELYNFHGCMKAAVKDRQLPGRGVTRVRLVMGDAGSKHLECEPVIWDDFRRGPAKLWSDVPWIAFSHKYTREELIELNPTLGKTVKLDVVVGEEGRKKGDSENLPDMFKRARVWEVWDKSTRKLYFFATSFKDGPLQVVSDPYELRGFFPVPEPLYAVSTPDSLIPVCEFTIWKALADEVDTLTSRIIGIVSVLKWKGLYDGAFAGLVEKLRGLSDGELAAADDAARSMKEGGIDKAIWMMPVDKAAALVESLYEAREQAKNQLYELTGVADILRGSTQASETATAQNIKAQWGSLRLQEAQAEIQRYARDLFRIMADLMIGKMDAAELAAMTGLQVTDQLLAPYKADLQREFAIEIETDSTIRADLSRTQQNITGFGEMFGQFIEGVTPLVQTGVMPGPIAIRILGGIMRNFKLGRAIESAFDDWQKHVEQQAANPQPPPKDPKVQAEEIKAQSAERMAQAKEREIALKGQVAQQDAQAKAQDRQMDMQERVAEFQMKMKELDAEMQAFAAEHGLRMQEQQQDAALAERQHQMAAEDQARGQEAAEHGHGLRMEVMDAQARAKQQAARNGGG